MIISETFSRTTTRVRDLGERRSRLLAELAEVEEKLRPAMSKMRSVGYTWQEIIAASGYASIEGVKKAIDPQRRERSNANARARRATSATAPE